MTIKCRHNGTWLIAGGSYEWCYECGAMRTTRETGIAQVAPDSPWLRPVGIKGENPWAKWDKARDSFRERRANRAMKVSA